MRILLLEDNDDDADLTLRELRKQGLEFTVRRVQTENDYRREVTAFAPDLILADYSLPTYDGLSALTVAREMCPATPFIFVSGTLGEETAIETLKHGATDYVLKQRLARLGPVVQRALREAAEHQQRQQMADRERLAHQTLELLNRQNDAPEAIRDILRLIQQSTGFEAVGIRLREGDDFPYAVQDGFSDDFLRTENSLTVPAREGGVCRDEAGNIRLECTCGLVIAGRTDPANAMFTPGGSFWTNESLPLLDLPAGQDPRLHPRNRCIHEGFHSVALIPLRSGTEIIGLLQLNDRRPQRFTPELIHFFEGLGASIAIALSNKRAVAALRESLRRFELLTGVAGDLLLTPDSQVLVETLCKRVMKHLDCHAFFNFLADKKAGRLHLNAWAGIPEEEARRLEWLDYGVAVCGCAARDACRIVAENIGTTPDPRTELVKAYGLRAYACHPLQGADGKVIGTLSFGTRTRDTFSADDLLLMKAVADQVAVAMMRAGAHAALRESATLYHSLVENLPQSVFRKDRAGRFLFCNQRFCEGLGRSVEEIVGQTDADLFPPQLAAAYRQDDLQVMATGQPLDRVEENLAADGRQLFVQVVKTPLLDAAGAVVGIQGIFWDVTERQQSLALIREQAALLDQTNDAILVRALAGEITFWNRGAEHMFGWTAPEILGRNATETLVPAATRGQFEEAERQVLEEGHWLGEVNYVTKTRQNLIGLARATLVRDAAGAPQSFLVLITDLTEQKKLEAQFLRAQRLEAVGTLASGIAHDLNNILAPILMAMPLLRAVQTPAEMAPTLDLIEASAQRAAAVIRQLLTFGRGQGGERIPLHLKHLLRDLYHIIHETFPKNIRYTHAAAPDLWPLVADPTQLHQILLNLCINARDAMPEGGTLTVTAANFAVDDQFAGMVAGAKPGAYVRLEVNDTGTGIAAEHLDQIFDPFFTTKAVGRGTGLGLATVHKVVISHGGFVQVRSRVGRGTTFEVYLPATPEAVAPAEPAALAAVQAGQGELILVVEDEDNIRQLVEKTLVRHGYRVVTASDGSEGIAIFAERQAEVKVVLTDLMMPVMDGLDLVRAVARMAPGLPVVVSTGIGDDSDQEEKLAALRRLGVATILTKPYPADQLLRALRAVLHTT